MGELWEVHGGGFYHVQKYRVAPRVLPERLAWFKWEAYTTWLSGFALLCIVYFSNARAYLIDRSVADLTVPEAIAISIGLLIAAWLVYDVALPDARALAEAARARAVRLHRALGVRRGAAVRSRARCSSGRLDDRDDDGRQRPLRDHPRPLGAHPRQARGREPDPAPGLKAKLRSVHNNYLTLPVVLAMLSNHFPFVYGHDDAWLVLCAFVVLGVYVRHFFNLRHAGRTRWSMPVVAAAAVVALALWLAPPDEPSAPASNATVGAGKRVFLTAGCVSCHTLERCRRRGTHRARPRRRQALARARDQPRDQRPGRDAVVREQALEAADRAGRRLRLERRRS